MNICVIKLPEIKLFGYHGCYDEEKRKGQEFEVNMEISLSSVNVEIAKEDDLINTINYVDIVNMIKADFNKNRHNLLETLAGRLAGIPYEIINNRNLSNNIISVKVGIKKYNPTGIDIPYIEVECIRNYE